MPAMWRVKPCTLSYAGDAVAYYNVHAVSICTKSIITWMGVRAPKGIVLSAKLPYKTIGCKGSIVDNFLPPCIGVNELQGPAVVAMATAGSSTEHDGSLGVHQSKIAQ